MLHRIDKLRALFAKEKIDSLLVSGASNIRYLTGFTGSNALLMVDEDSATFFTDGRYTTQAREELSGSKMKILIPRAGLWKEAFRRLKKNRRRTPRVGFDAGVSYALYKKIIEELGEKRPKSVSGLVERLRIVKDESEIAAIRESCALNSRVHAEVLKLVRFGVSERDIASEIDYRMRRMGATGPAFDTIVAAGERSALPHAHPTGRVIGAPPTDAQASASPGSRGEFLLFDHGSMVHGYCSDMTRTVWVGSTPPAKARELYATVLEAHQKAKEAVRAGVSCAAVDRAARDPIRAKGWAKYFSHSTGHGVGLDIHESPRIAARVKDKLPAGAVITIEPGVYLPGFGGVRIEDMVVVRENGAEDLTPSPKSFMELPA